MKYYKYIRTTLILVPIITLVFLIYKDFNPRGVLKVDYDFCREDPFISKFSPLGRVLAIEKNGEECRQQMVLEPVYFDVRLPQKFDSASLTLWYEKMPGTPLLAGPAADLDNWQWQLKKLVGTDTNRQSFGSAEYNLKNIKLNNNRLRFLISSPGLDASGEKIIFKKIEIEFFKDQLSKNNYIQKIKDWIKFSNLYKIFIILNS